MSTRTTLTLVLVATSVVIVVVIAAMALWRLDESTPTVSPEKGGRPIGPVSHVPDEPIPVEPGPASAPPPEPPVAETQAEAETLKRQAVQVAGELVEAFPNDAVTYALLGAAHHNIGNSDEAAKWLRRCLDLDPERADAYGMLAMIASKKGDFEQTVTWCKEALKRNPAMRDVQHRLGRALMDLGETDQLIRIMEQVVKMPPRSSESYYLLGQGYLQSGDYLKAKESFRIVVGIRPDHTQANFGLFTACRRLKQKDEAEEYGKRFQELEAIDRNAATDRNVDEDTLSGLPMVREMVAKTYAGAGQIYYRHKDFPQAEKLWRKSAGLDPNNTVCRAALMTFYLRQKRESHALELFDQLAKEQPGNGLNHYYRGRLLVRLRQFDAAEQAYQKVTELSPGRPEGYRAGRVIPEDQSPFCGGEDVGPEGSGIAAQRAEFLSVGRGVCQE